MKLISRIATACALTVGLATATHAHNLWLLPSSTVLSKADWVTVDAAVSNDVFFFNHRPLNVQSLQVVGPDGTTVPVENAHSGKLRTVFDVNLTKPGTYRLAIVNAGLNASWKDAAGQTKRWRGTPENFAKQVPADAQELRVTQSAGRIETFVTVGKPSVYKPSGAGLELIPVTHPNDLVKGEKATFVMHVDGKPTPDVEVVVVAGGTRYRDSIGELKLKTDAKGEFSVTWPGAGMYWIDADLNDSKTSVPQAKERRLSYVGTVEVLP